MHAGLPSDGRALTRTRADPRDRGPRPGGARGPMGRPVSTGRAVITKGRGPLQLWGSRWEKGTGEASPQAATAGGRGGARVSAARLGGVATC